MVKKNGETEILRCSFCNKDQNDVRKLIAGPTVFICDECVEVCNDIIADDNRFENRGTRSSLPTPQEIKKVLDEYVIGLERTKKKLAVPALLILFPELQSASSHFGVGLVGTVSAADDACLAPRGGAGVAWSPRIDQSHPRTTA